VPRISEFYGIAIAMYYAEQVFRTSMSSTWVRTHRLQSGRLKSLRAHYLIALCDSSVNGRRFIRQNLRRIGSGLEPESRWSPFRLWPNMRT
jgi:hypothetical protein